MSIFFLIGLKSLNFKFRIVWKVNGLFFARRYLWVNINVSNFISLHWLTTLKLFCKWILHTYVSLFSNKALNMKVYDKIRGATAIVRLKGEAFLMLFGCWSSPVLLVVFSATACIGAHSPAVELDNAIRFRLRSDPH